MSPTRVGAGAVALTATAMALSIAINYPIWPLAVTVLLLAWAVLCYRWPALWLALVPVAMPALGFASWTGWLIVEELDLLLAGVVIGGYARVTLGAPGHLDPSRTPETRARMHTPLASAILLTIYLSTSALALVRGYLDAGTTALNWTQGYFDSLNSLRLFKGFAWALLLSPLLLDRLNEEPRRSSALLSWGICGGLALVALGALWERAAFPGIFDFSTDYRTTSLFWEMHVGGAALDGYLALAVPFALWLAVESKERLVLVAAGTVLLLACYAALTTFSRGVFLALPVGVAVWALLRARQRARTDAEGGWRAELLALVFVGVAVLIAWAVFQQGGYRGLLACLTAFAALAHALPTMRSLTSLLLLLAFGSGLLGGLGARGGRWPWCRRGRTSRTHCCSWHSGSWRCGCAARRMSRLDF